ncbi:hypothetical protein C8C88_0753 [Flavobacterium sp. 123]|nr:hypothetical protein C8C88_0753 [Flavobacterium sp. 123]
MLQKMIPEKIDFFNFFWVVKKKNSPRFSLNKNEILIYKKRLHN